MVFKIITGNTWGDVREQIVSQISCSFHIDLHYNGWYKYRTGITNHYLCYNILEIMIDTSVQKYDSDIIKWTIYIIWQ